MGALDLARFVFGLGTITPFLFGCGGSEIHAGIGDERLAASLAHKNTYTYEVIYSFKGGNDGWFPASEAAPLAVMNGSLYGTTAQGGGTGCSSGCGTVFTVSPSGGESVIYAFDGKPDGINPSGTVTNVGGTWYGMTYLGGANGDGAVFAVDSYGHEKVIYSFKGGSGDGSGPFGQLIAFNGTLYGTTTSGGSDGYGTVFTLTPSGSERVLHSFTFYDGANPYAGLTVLNGTLYGTTISGGTHGYGTVFAISTSGQERVVYSFKYGRDGAAPQAPLTLIAGHLYGTTTDGGGGHRYLGTVFKISPSGKEHVLHRFAANGIDGTFPQSALVDLNGTLYGTTYIGGRGDGGIVFGLTLSGKETILYHFKGVPDGKYPTGGLAAINGTLYGTTTQGGAGPCYYGRSPYGCGTVFALTP